MVDFHSHILPQIDDGSKSVEMSIEMLRISKNYGVETMVATPHFYAVENSVKKFLERREKSYDRLLNEIEKKNIKDIPKILLGAEVRLYNGIDSIDNVDKLCTQGTNLMLIEMPFVPWSSRDIRTVANIISLGIKPIMAHIERYPKIQKDFSRINDIINMAVYIQMNASAFKGFFAKKDALDTVRHDIIHIIASDCHNLDVRKPNLPVAFKAIEKHLGKDVADRLKDNSVKILKGEKLK